MTMKRVLVIGGGIGGLAAAIGCRQGGIAVDLVEAKLEWTVYGVGIFQSNNALRALDRIGLARECVEAGGPFPGMRLYDAEGGFMIASAASNAAAPAFPPVNGIARPALHRILTDAAEREGVAVRLGVTAVDSHDAEDGAHVVCSDATEGRYDAVIAADGIYSRTRRRLFGDAARPRALGQTVWRYNLPRPAGLEWGEVHYGQRQKVGLIPISPTVIYLWLLTQEAPGAEFPPDQLAPLMRARLANWSGMIGDLREQITDSAQVVQRANKTILLPSPWASGRTILIGDAAHATTPHLGQGAAMAIEDGVLLAELLSRHGSYQGAFDEFMRRRFDRVKRVIDTSNQLAEWELSEWRGEPDPAANPGQLNGRTSAMLLEDY